LAAEVSRLYSSTLCNPFEGCCTSLSMSNIEIHISNPVRIISEDGVVNLVIDSANRGDMIIHVIVKNEAPHLDGCSATTEKVSEPEHIEQLERVAFLEKIEALLDRNLDDHQFGIPQLCTAMGISRAQIYRKFKILNHRTPHGYLRSYRLIRAKELLLGSTLNVSEVAFETGFSNVSHFSRIFTEEFGKPPSDFRRKTIMSA